MRQQEVKQILRYSQMIPQMRRLLLAEREELEEEYDSLRGISFEAVPGGGAVENPVERRTARLEELGAHRRLKEIETGLSQLARDAETVRMLVDGLNPVYKTLLRHRYREGFSWAAISARMRIPDSTLRGWHDRALTRLAEAIEALSDAPGLIERASRARI